MQKLLEKDIQNVILEYLVLKKYFCWRQNNIPVVTKNGGFRAMPKFSKNGIPDIILVCPHGLFVGLEVKRPGGKQSDAQKEFQRGLEEMGGRYHLVESLESVIALGF